MAVARSDPCPININVAGRQSAGSQVFQTLGGTPGQHPPALVKQLGLDVTESLVMEDLASVAEVIDQCRHLGLKVALDDFGTGFSSLTHLKRIAVDELKIDSSFIATMLKGPQDLAVVQSVIALASAFKRDVSAEGVETLDQVLMLLELGCDVMQGYHLARPMPAGSVWNGTAGLNPAPYGNCRFRRARRVTILNCCWRRPTTEAGSNGCCTTTAAWQPTMSSPPW
jgi:EAL domain-containing protein (putative c-di-GMP-specific phosphodiesterase class I)